MTVLDGYFHILAGGGILFLFASCLIYQKSAIGFQYGICIAFLLLFPEAAMIYANIIERKKAGDVK